MNATKTRSHQQYPTEPGEKKTRRKKRMIIIVSFIVLILLLLAIACELASLFAFFDSLKWKGAVIGKIFPPFGFFLVLGYGIWVRLFGFAFFLISLICGLVLLPSIIPINGWYISAGRWRNTSLVLLLLCSVYFSYTMVHVFTLPGLHGRGIHVTWPIALPDEIFPETPPIHAVSPDLPPQASDAISGENPEDNQSIIGPTIGEPDESDRN